MNVATALVHQSLYHIIKSTCTKELTQSHVLESLKSCAALIRHTIPPLLLVVGSKGPHRHFHICSQQASTRGSNYCYSVCSLQEA